MDHSHEPKHNVVEVVLNIQRMTVNGATIQELLDYAKDSLKKITDSEFAYISQTSTKNTLKTLSNPNGTCMKCMSIDDLSWNETTKNMYNERLVKGIELSKEDTLYGVSLTSKKVIISDNVQNDSRRGGVCKLPEGHPPIKTFAAIPLIHTGNLIGQIGLANRKKKYTNELIQSLELLILQITKILFNNKCLLTIEELTKREDLVRAKNMFMANVSHEIRTPLNSIIGMMALLESSPLSDSQKECVNIARQSSYDLLALINDILDITKLEANGMKLNIKSMNIREVIESSIDIISYSAAQKSLPIKIDISNDVPDFVLGDQQRIRQMIVNLLTNAVKFTNKGFVSIKVEIATDNDVMKLDLKPLNFYKSIKQNKANSAPNPNELNPKVPKQSDHVQTRRFSTGCIDENVDTKIGEWIYLKFSVIDTGIGIKETDINKLFRSFVQLDDSSTKLHKGTGLGLSIAHKICELMDGNISLESTFGKGSTFYFILPMQIYHDIPKNIDYSILEGINVLVVDDDPGNLKRAIHILDQYGVNHQTCSFPRMALTSYAFNKRYSFDIGLIDIIMPDMDGNEFAKNVSKAEKPFPLIALSSKDENVHNVDTYFAEHIQKPYTDDQLLRAMIRLLQKRQGSPKPNDSSNEDISDTSAQDIENEINDLKNSGVRQSSSSSDLSNTPREDSPTKNPRKISSDGRMSSPTGIISYGNYRSNIQNKKHGRRPEEFFRTAENFNINILLADDNNNNVITMTKMLKTIGYQNIECVNNGREAVNKIIENKGMPLRSNFKVGEKKNKKSNYHVILMDILMPELDGIQAAREICNLFDDKKHRPRIIAITAANIDEQLEIGIKRYMDDILMKPIVEISHLAKALENVTL